MAQHKVVTTDAEIEAAVRRAQSEPEEPRIKSVRYVAEMDIFVLQMSDGTYPTLPRKLVQELQGVSRAKAAKVVADRAANAIRWPELDVDLYVPSLVEGIFGTKKWMSDIGKLGGAVRSKSKSEAARRNGAKGGRPRKEPSAAMTKATQRRSLAGA